MSSPVTVPMLSPDGQSGDVPIANVAAARQAGFKVAVTMQSPDGKTGYVPTENTQAAVSKGFKMVPTVVAVWAKYGVTKIKDLKPKDYTNVLADLKALNA